MISGYQCLVLNRPAGWFTVTCCENILQLDNEKGIKLELLMG